MFRDIGHVPVTQAWRAGCRRSADAATRAPKHGGHGKAFPPFDPTTFASQLLWLAITFGIFYLFMPKVIVPRIGGILENAAATASRRTSTRRSG